MSAAEIYILMMKLEREYYYDLTYVTPQEPGYETVYIEFYKDDKDNPLCSWNFNRDFYEQYLKGIFNK